MDPALRLLLKLRMRGRLRRIVRSLGTVKGAVLALVGAIVFVPWVISMLVMPTTAGAQDPEVVRRFGTLSLFAYCVLTTLFAPVETAINFSPAEVNFLFSGPFSRRQMLGYKIVSNAGAILFMTLFMSLLLRQYTSSFLASLVGLFLVFLFFQQFSMAMALSVSILGAQADSRRRKLVLISLAALVGAALIPLGRDLANLTWTELLERLEQAPVVRSVLAPLGWFVKAFTAGNLWPDLVQWSLLGLAVDLVLVVIVFALDAQYLESAAASSERMYARLQRIRAGGGIAAWGKTNSGRRRSLPSFPWWWGAGPMLWRQLTTAWRSAAGMIFLLLVMGFIMIWPALASAGNPDRLTELLPIVGGLLAGMTFFMTPMVGFDFRGDIDRMDILKSLPVPPASLVVGQVAAPVLVVSIIQWIVVAIIQVFVAKSSALLLTAAFFVPFNFLLFGIENLLFLWFPTRLIPTAPGDFQGMGRNMIVMFAKVLTLGLVGGVAALAGFLAYYVAGERLGAGLVTAWLILVAFDAALVPLVAQAFRHFDVARDTPP